MSPSFALLAVYSPKNAFETMNGPIRLGIMFFKASSAEVSSMGWTVTYPAALIKIEGNRLVSKSLKMALKADSTDGSEVMSHS